MNNNEVNMTLKNLIRACVAGRDAFKAAAETIQNSEFRRLFNIFSQQRAQFITELEAEVHRLGGDTTADDSTKPLPENTVRFRATSAKPVGMRDEPSVIADCRREEEFAVNEYQEALKGDLPLDVQYVVKRQYMDIKDAYDRIRILQRAA
jgi:uncharacterized protein (TIGR02284 family)